MDRDYTVNATRTIVEVIDVDDSVTRYNCYCYTIENGTLVIYDRGIIAAFAAGQWKRLRIVSDDEL